MKALRSPRASSQHPRPHGHSGRPASPRRSRPRSATKYGVHSQPGRQRTLLPTPSVTVESDPNYGFPSATPSPPPIAPRSAPSSLLPPSSPFRGGSPPPARPPAPPSLPPSLPPAAQPRTARPGAPRSRSTSSPAAAAGTCRSGPPPEPRLRNAAPGSDEGSGRERGGGGCL